MNIEMIAMQDCFNVLCPCDWLPLHYTAKQACSPSLLALYATGSDRRQNLPIRLQNIPAQRHVDKLAFAFHLNQPRVLKLFQMV